MPTNERMEGMKKILINWKEESEYYIETSRYDEQFSKYDAAKMFVPLAEAILLLMEAMEGEKRV